MPLFKKVPTKAELYGKVRIDSLPKNVKETIPYKAICKNGVIETEEGVFTKQFRLTDANFEVASEEVQESMFGSYEEFINTFSHDVRFQITIHNHKIDKVTTMERIRIAPQSDNLNPFRRELNEMYAAKMLAGTNNITQNKYLTISTKASTVDDAMIRINNLTSDLKKSLQKIVDDPVEEMTIEDRLKLLYEIYNQNSRFRFMNAKRGEKAVFDLDALEKYGLDSKDCVGPDSFEFKRNMMIFGDSVYGQGYTVKMYPEILSSEFLADVTSLPFELLTSLTYEPIDMARTSELVRNHMVALDAEADGIRRANRESGSGDYIPDKLQKAVARAHDLLDDVQSRNQKLFNMTASFVIFAGNEAKLKENVDRFKDICAKHQVHVTLKTYEQEEVLATALPLCRNNIYGDRLFNTESASVFLPYTSQELMQKNAIYYGTNSVTHNLILYDRLSANNYNMLVFGASGSGKSFTCKQNMTSILLKYPNAQVFVIDPENEYSDLAGSSGLRGQVINISAGSKHHINPLDMDMDYAMAEDGTPMDPIPMKSDYILSMMSIMAKRPDGIDPQSSSLLDRCVRKMYKGYVEHMEQNKVPLGITNDPSNAPTLLTLYNILRRMGSPNANYLADILETYATGSFSTFSNKTNVDTDSRFVVYNTNGIGTGLKDLGLFVCLNDIWLRAIENSKRGIYSYVFIDEFYLLLQSHAASLFLMEIWKRARKWLCCPCGIMQNTEDLLYSKEGRAIIDNTSLVVMLSEPKSDRNNLAEMFNLSMDELDYITNSKKGSGLIWNNKFAIPFENDFPKDTKLFKLMESSAAKKTVRDRKEVA